MCQVAGGGVGDIGVGTGGQGGLCPCWVVLVAGEYVRW